MDKGWCNVNREQLLEKRAPSVCKNAEPKIISRKQRFLFQLVRCCSQRTVREDGR